MLLLNPRRVTFGSRRLDGIAAVAIDRTPHRSVEEWSDLGPYATLADVPEQRIRIVITQELAATDTDPPIPGEQATIALYTGPGTADAARKKISAAAVILEVRHELSKRGATRTITLAAVSADGAADPITISDASTGEI